MKKYKVVTDNLDWFGIYNNDTIKFEDDLSIIVERCRPDMSDRKITESDWFTVKRLFDMQRLWFEEIKEKNWEILEWDNDYHITTVKQPIKVKRLSDGEVFSVGDNTSCGVIWKFEVQGDMVRVMFNGNWKYHVNFIGLKHIKIYEEQQLFTEQDVVDFGLFFYNKQGKGSDTWGKCLFKEWLKQRDK